MAERTLLLNTWQTTIPQTGQRFLKKGTIMKSKSQTIKPYNRNYVKIHLFYIYKKINNSI